MLLRTYQGSGELTLPSAEVEGAGSIVKVGSGAIALPTVGVIGTGSAMGDGDLDITGLQGWYRFDETSSTSVAVDAHTTNRTLSVNGNPFVDTGKVGGSRRLGGITTGDLNNFFRDEPAFVFTNQSHYVSFWLSFSSLSSNRNLLGVYNLSSAQREKRRWGVRLLDDDTLQYLIKPNSGDVNDLYGAVVAPTLNEWNFIECFYDQPNQTIGIALNKGSFVTTSTPLGMSTTASSGEQARFYVFRFNTINSNGFRNGNIDELTIWSTLPTDSRRDYLWNDGAGNTYPT